MGNSTRLRFKAVTLGAAVAAVVALATACSQAAPPKPKPHPAAPVSTPATAPPVGPHGGVDLNMLVVTDGTGAVEAIHQQLTTEGLPSTVIDLRDSSRPTITRDFLARKLPDGTTVTPPAVLGACIIRHGLELVPPRMRRQTPNVQITLDGGRPPKLRKISHSAGEKSRRQRRFLLLQASCCRLLC